ncbi:MAG: SUMF1/EgtB/PvdO family nonheme iron enzyme, partial [Myxococcota bacterium]
MWITLITLLCAPEPPPVVPCTDPPEGMVCVPGGWFERGFDRERFPSRRRFGGRKAWANAVPAEPVWLQTYFIDVDEVTFEAYERCIDDKKCTVRPEDGRWGPRYTDFNRPRQPITGINWYQADEFCRAHGKRLPTEAQWEKAARGPEGEAYPWGDAPLDCSRAVYKSKKGRSCGVKKRGTASIGRVIEVGSRPAHRYGTHDLIGNVEE